MAWDTPSVNRGRHPQATGYGVAPVARRVSFGEILGRVVLAVAVALVFGGVASWVVPSVGETTRRLIELGVGAAGFASALWLQWRPRRHGLPQHMLDAADRRWIGGRQYDSETSDCVVGESLVEIAIDVAIDISTD